MDSTYIFGEGGSRDKASLELATKKGTHIRNVRREERARESMLDAEQRMKAACPGIVTRSLSSTYNCVGLVFGARRTVIDSDDVDWILKEDGYQKLSGDLAPVPGDLVVYRTTSDAAPTHIGVVVECGSLVVGSEEKTIRVLSQWGADGEYLHDYRQVPKVYGSIIEFYSERRILT